MSVNEASVQGALSKVVDPNTGKDLGKSGRNIKVSGNDVALDIELGYPGKRGIALGAHGDVRVDAVIAVGAAARQVAAQLALDVVVAGRREA